MRVRSLCLLLLLTLIALPAWSAAPAASPETLPQITLADILAPAPAPLAASAAPDIFQEFACVPCSSDAYCQSLCECSAAVCTFNSFCQKKICNCTVCP
jgi:hypothetical protein